MCTMMGVANLYRAKMCDTSDKMNVGQNIKAWRRHRQLTQEQLAERTGLARTHIARLEAGDVAYTARTLGAIAAALSIDVATVLLAPPEDGAPEFFRAVEASGIARPSRDRSHDATNGERAGRGLKVDPGDQQSAVSEAIAHGVAAAACRMAAATVTESRELWASLAEEESEEASRALGEVAEEAGVYVIEAEDDPVMVKASLARAHEVHLRGERTGCKLNWPDDITRTIRIAMPGNAIVIEVDDDKTQRLYWRSGTASAFMGLVERVGRGSWVFRPSPAAVRGGKRALVATLANAILAEKLLQKEIRSGTDFW